MKKFTTEVLDDEIFTTEAPLNEVEEAEYKGYTEYKNHKSEIFQISILGKINYLIANRNIENKLFFYSITQSDKVLIGIKKMIVSIACKTTTYALTRQSRRKNTSFF